jgi:hypothetical protein
LAHEKSRPESQHVATVESAFLQPNHAKEPPERISYGIRLGTPPHMAAPWNDGDLTRNNGLVLNETTVRKAVICDELDQVDSPAAQRRRVGRVLRASEVDLDRR